MATITTKFEVGQKVFFLHDEKVTTDTIAFINISIKQWKFNDEKEYGDQVEYALQNHYKDRHHPILHRESVIFSSAQGLADSILNQALSLI